ncbi:MAG: serine hydrolase [Bacteroidota bacterium]
MRRATTYLTIALLIGSIQKSMANNGFTAYIYPLTGITIDGDLGDWPAEVQIHSMTHVHYGDGISGPEDAEVSWRAGYDRERGCLYVGVQMQDDDYVKTPDNDHYSSHDFQVLYIDPAHNPDGSGVIAYEIDEDHRKIVEQEMLSFYPQVKDASYDQIELQIKRVGDVVTYEWKIEIGGPLVSGRVIGFDYAAFDKDTDQNHVMITWGARGGDKFQNANRIGDLILLENGNEIAEVSGNLAWLGTSGTRWPNVVRLTRTDNINYFYSAKIDSTGSFRADVPTGNYRVSIPTSRNMIDWNKIEIIEAAGEEMEVKIKSDRETKLQSLLVRLVEAADLISDNGILHSPFDESTAKQVDEFVAAYQSRYIIPGVSLALIQDGELVYHKVYGVENAMTNKPMRPEAVFEAASITKLVFAYAMNRLVQRGEFDLDKPLYETLPFPELEKYPEYKLMTGRHVLTHVTGLPNWGAELINKPGTTYGYSGEGFEYLKKVLAGEVSDDLPGIIQGHLDREILDPLGMNNTYFMCNDILPERKVAGHIEGIPNMFDCPDWPGMAFSMHTEAKDFVPFALALLNREGLTAEQAEEMFRFHTLMEEEEWMNGYRSGFGLGVALRDSPHGLVFGHGGNNGDFRCSFEMYDELRAGFIAFTNADTAGPFLYDLAQFLFEGKWEE